MDYYLIIAGSRGFNNYPLLKDYCDEVVREFDKSKTSITVVSGGAWGADKLGEKWAVERGFSIIKFIPNWDKYGKRAGMIRNNKMAKVGDGLIAFWDGESRGTAHMIECAHANNLDVHVKRI